MINSNTIYPAGARSGAGTTSFPLNNSRGNRGIKIFIDLTAFTTAASLTVTIRGKDPVSGKTWVILASAAIAANSTVILTVFPGVAAVANVSANDAMPPVGQLDVTLGNANSHTFSVGYAWLK